VAKATDLELCIRTSCEAKIDLRDTFASRLRRNGVALEDIATLLGREIPQLRMTLRYAHADMRRLHQAVGALVRSDTNRDTSRIAERKAKAG
jgi:integrase